MMLQKKIVGEYKKCLNLTLFQFSQQNDVKVNKKILHLIIKTFKRIKDSDRFFHNNYQSIVHPLRLSALS